MHRCATNRLASVLALIHLPAASRHPGGRASATNRDVPIFMAHGTADPVIPTTLRGVRRSAHRRRLSAGLEESYRGHNLCMEVRDIGDWLATVLAATEAYAGRRLSRLLPMNESTVSPR